MSDIEILLPKEKIVRISGKKYTISKLSLAQNIKLLRLVGSLHESVREKIAKDAEGGKNDMAAILEAIAAENTGGLLRILLKSEDDFSDISLEDFSEIIAAVTEVNDFEKIFANFQRTAKNLKGIAGEIKKLLSLPSSEK